MAALRSSLAKGKKETVEKRNRENCDENAKKGGK